ncbi:TPA: MSHA biogenesis protein MshQ [Vibrio fluvialis]|nr:MSHA biogenesis protein MshQ [Vibrio fluvialis]HDM8041893.1 MSHA biogenesis protein MshQ [Vibrio fluvialis]
MVNSQRYLRVMVLIGALLWSSLSFAFTSGACSTLRSDGNFGVTFSIDNARLTETVNAIKGVGNNTKVTIPLWSNDTSVSSPIIRDSETELGGSYQIWLKYEQNNNQNKTGDLSYYLLRFGQWELIGTPQFADLRNLDSVNIDVISSDVDEMACEETSQPPFEPTLDICDYFPDSFQSNSFYNGSRYAGTFELNGDRNTLVLPKRAPLAFNQIAVAGHDSGCVYNGSSPESCLYDAAITYPGFPGDLPDFQSGTQEIVCNDGCQQSLTQGKYKKIEIGSNHSTVTLQSGEYWVDELIFSTNDASLKVQGKVYLHFRSLKISGDRVRINSGGSPENLWMFGHIGAAPITISNNDVSITAMLFLDAPSFTNSDGLIAQGARLKFTGSLTASRIKVTNNDSTFTGHVASACDTTVDSSYALTLQPAEAYSLICAAQRLEFQVVDSNNQATGDFTGTISVSPASASLALIQGKSSGSNGSYTPNANGELWLDLTASSSQTVTITGTLNPQGDSASVSGTYHFVPYKLSASDQYVIANKPQTVELKALACDDNGGVVDINYGGTPTVSSAWVAPTSGVGSLTFAPSFTQGVASSELTMEDSGIKTVTMTDSSFDCSGLTDCPVEGSGTLQGSFTVYSRPWTLAICSPNGSTMDGDITNPDSLAFTSAGNLFALNIRPLRWVSGSGDDSSPQAGGSAIETSAYCSSAVTQNFFSDNSQLAALAVLSHQVAQPADGNDGTLDGTLEQLNTTGINSTYLPFSGVSWSEVGVLRVNADISGSYLGMMVNQGYRDIGRFYPAWLSITENSWDYADDHNGFVYMNQTIPYRFTVEAQNMQSDATTNYSAFSQALIADVKLLAVDSDGEELSDRIDEYDLQLWDGAGDGAWSGATLSVSNDFTFLKQQQSASPYTSSVDGPYQSGFGLRVSDKVDGVDFVSPDLELKASTTLLDTGKRFTTQPDIRYGRMVLGDVGGTSVSTVNVPLRVEYWQGSRFAINADDSGSYFATPNEYVCKQTVWPTSGSGSSSKLIGSDTPSSWAKVASGKSSVVFATPASSDETADVREQVRFWLRLDDDAHSSPQLLESGVNCGAQYTSQPWLQYNWRDKGDEDPSAVVTFGIHRGNDKVIFRGETRLTGQ